MDRHTSPASRGSSGIPSPRLSFPAVELAEDSVRFGAPVGAAGKFLGALGTEQALVGEIGDPGLTLRGTLRRPGRETDFAHGFRDLAHFFAAPPAMFDDALEKIGALLLPIDARKSLRQRSQHRVLDAVGPRGRETLDDHRSK